MDYALTRQIPQFAADLLFTSQTFEPFIPQSLANPLNALHLLGSLENTTRLSLKLWQETHPSPVAKPASNANDLSQAPKQKSPETLTPEQKLLQALQSLRDSQLSFKRPPGVYATILRPGNS